MGFGSFGFDSFRRVTDIVHRALDVNMLRYQVTANNLSNAGVQGFKRSVVNFETELKRALDSEANKEGSFKMNTSHPLHIESSNVIDYKTVRPFVALDYATASKANGNNVDAEEEAMNVLKIQMQYQLLSQVAAFEYNQVQSVLK